MTCIKVNFIVMIFWDKTLRQRFMFGAFFVLELCDFQKKAPFKPYLNKLPLTSLKNEDILSSKKDISVNADASIDLPDSSIVDTREKGIDSSEKEKKEKKHKLKVKSFSLQKN